MASSRFPGKPMADIHGIPMIGHCLFRVSMCSELEATYVATCDKEIFDYVESVGGRAIMTSHSHERASDRAAEAMISVEKETGEKTDILVMVQGDEPMDTQEMVSQAIAPMLSDESIKVVNLMGEIKSSAEFEDPNVVKVVVGPDNNAIYFSREPIPSRKKTDQEVPMLKQVCIIPFRRDYLLEYNQTPQTALEKIESVDMMRVIETGDNVRMVMTEYQSIGVDTPDDLEMVRELMLTDELIDRYRP
jgi:3-deoxy-manno-octulosonate cytidylyltransferase (CMP-KDO synthetase)